MSVARQIMIVEDDEIIANLITLMLEKKGYHIAGKVSSGEEAVLKAADLNPDLVLMDINLSGLMDGITAARFIFSLFHFPVIFLTGYCDDQLIERAKSAQPYGYLLKPFTENDLVSNIAIALHNHDIRRQYLDRFVVGDTKKILTVLEAVIITDLKGRIVYFNPYTPRLLEFPERELMMAPSKNAMTLMNAQTREIIEDPVSEVVKQMLVVTHEFNTTLITHTDREKPVSVIARPLKNEQNELFGIIIILREKTLAEIRMTHR